MRRGIYTGILHTISNIVRYITATTRQSVSSAEKKGKSRGPKALTENSCKLALLADKHLYIGTNSQGFTSASIPHVSEILLEASLKNKPAKDSYLKRIYHQKSGHPRYYRSALYVDRGCLDGTHRYLNMNA
jgi:hypothetical protein